MRFCPFSSVAPEALAGGTADVKKAKETTPESLEADDEEEEEVVFTLGSCTPCVINL